MSSDILSVDEVFPDPSIDVEEDTGLSLDIASAVSKLSCTQIVIIGLRSLKYTQVQVAEITGLKRVTVGSIERTANTQLKELLKEYYLGTST